MTPYCSLATQGRCQKFSWSSADDLSTELVMKDRCHFRSIISIITTSFGVGITVGACGTERASWPTEMDEGNTWGLKVFQQGHKSARLKQD